MNPQKRPKKRVKGPLISVGAFLGKYFQDKGLDGKLQEYKIWTHWKEIVGPSLANKCAPLHLSHHKLMITVTTAPWLTQLQLMKLQLIEKMMKKLGIQIKDIYFKVGPLPMDHSKIVSTPAISQPTQDLYRDAEENTRIKNMQSDVEREITDPELKTIIQRVLERHVAITEK